jgi:Ser/Thr protein kinase RdoA (MazF antagonist)
VQDQREGVVAAVCEQVLGATPVAVTTPPTGNSKRTALVDLADGREVVVQYRDAARPLDAEVAVTRAVAARTTVPVAPVLAAGRLGDPPVSYLVTERVAGADLHERFAGLDAADRERLARTLGRYLAAVHEAFAFDAPGRVRAAGASNEDDEGEDASGSDASEDAGVSTSGAADDVDRADVDGAHRANADDADRADADSAADLVVAEPLPGGAFYRQYLDRALADWPAPLADLEPRVEAALGGRLDDLPADDARLFPWDYRPGNVIVREGDAGPAVAAVLDWGEPLAAPAGLSAAKAECTLCDWYVRAAADVAALREAYRAGYRAVRPFPDEASDAFRLLGLVASAADSHGEVTRPRYPVVDAAEAVTFHRERIAATLARLD